MVRMRIPIREQLGCLVLLASMIGLAVIAIATWVTNHNFVLSIRWVDQPVTGIEG
jgi:osomolarity two-component system sensor histidine kinase SLN1